MVERTKNSTFSRPDDHFEPYSMVAVVSRQSRGQAKLIPISVRIKARNLYVSQGMGAHEVAESCGLTRDQVYRLANNYGWTKTRKEATARLAKGLDDKTIALTDEISDAIASECEELAMAGLKRAREAVVDTHKDAPKNYQAWTAGIRNLATARNVIRGSRESNMDTGSESRHINLFFMGGAAKTEKRVGELDSVL